MKLSEWLDKWSISYLKVNTALLNMEFKPNYHDKNAAWELYIELLTRVTTQSIPEDFCDEKTTLQSIYSLYDTTRKILKKYGRHGNEFSKIAIIILNQKVRPFTTKWHNKLLDGELDTSKNNNLFREELSELQTTLIIYTKMLSDMAGVEDLTELEKDYK